MDIFKKRNKIIALEIAKESEREPRQPNHSSYEDDPLLNIEPVFENSPEAAAMAEKLKINKNQDMEIDNSTPKFQTAFRPKLNSNNPLSSIINNAIENSNNLKQEVNDSDPVIAKLNKIEELKRTGQTTNDESLYTDLSKSKHTSFIAKAREIANENSQTAAKSIIHESNIERAMRLQREAEEARLRKAHEAGKTYNGKKPSPLLENINQDNESVDDQIRSDFGTDIVDDTLMVRRKLNNQNAFAINIDKSSFYIKNNNAERVAKLKQQRRDQLIAQGIIKESKPINDNNKSLIKPLKEGVISEENSQSLLNSESIFKRDMNPQEAIMETEEQKLEKELIDTLYLWQQTQVDKLNKMVQSKIEQIQAKTFKSEEEKMLYIKDKISTLIKSIDKHNIEGK